MSQSILVLYLVAYSMSGPVISAAVVSSTLLYRIEALLYSNWQESLNLRRGGQLETDLSFWLPVGLVAAGAASLTLYSAWNRVGKGRYLCDDCRFNNEKDCLKAERPKAVICTSYRASQDK